MLRVAVVALLSTACWGHADNRVLAAHSSTLLLSTSYSFETYLEEYGKTYNDPTEYAHRKTIFEANLAAIDQHNIQGIHTYLLGVNQFTDVPWSDVPLGYVKPHYARGSSGPIVSSERRLLDLESIMTTQPVSELPKEVNWRLQGVSTPVKNQYYCGSCWAFASTATIESHVAIATGTLYSLSEQQLVSCAPNPLHCGGTGGCAGSTAEIAMEYVRTHGMVDEWAFGYESNHGASIPCTLEEDRKESPSWMLRGAAALLPQSDTTYVKGAVASIHAWATLPRNNYTAVMNAVAKLGPLSVSVACSPWIAYKSGVYSGSLETQKETDINHLVVLEGYGTDENTGEDYWLIRNSWGPRWGEAGYIRLKRVDPATLDDPELDCGTDTTPDDGVACTMDEDGNPIRPPDEHICGNSGLLYDVTIPLGAHLI